MPPTIFIDSLLLNPKCKTNSLHLISRSFLISASPPSLSPHYLPAFNTITENGDRDFVLSGSDAFNFSVHSKTGVEP